MSSGESLSVSLEVGITAYSERDYDLLLTILDSASRIVVTPSTITETSNLAANIAEPARKRIYETLRKFLHAASTNEIYVASARAADHAAFRRLGITDAALLSLVATDQILLTADLDLYLAATSQGQRSVNFNHSIEANRP